MDDEMVVVATFRHRHEAELAKMQVSAEGIRAELQDAEAISADPLLANALGDIKLLVPASEAEAASELLAELEEPTAEGAGDEVGSSCLACGKAMGEDEERCAGCGWSYLDEDAG